MRKVVLMFALVLLALPTAAQAQDKEHAKAALKEMTPKWQAAFNAGDAAGVAALYTKDGVLLPPNSAPVEGREAITAFWAAILETGTTGELTPQQMYGMGENAAEVGMFVLTGADGSHLDHGHYTLVYEMVDGEWQIASDMWNSDMSP